MRVTEGRERNCRNEGELESPRPWGEATSTRAGERDSLQLSDQRMLQGNWDYRSRQAVLSQLNSSEVCLFISLNGRILNQNDHDFGAPVKSML